MGTKKVRPKWAFDNSIETDERKIGECKWHHHHRHHYVIVNMLTSLNSHNNSVCTSRIILGRRMQISWLPLSPQKSGKVKYLHTLHSFRKCVFIPSSRKKGNFPPNRKKTFPQWKKGRTWIARNAKCLCSWLRSSVPFHMTSQEVLMLLANQFFSWKDRETTHRVGHLITVEQKNFFKGKKTTPKLEESERGREITGMLKLFFLFQRLTLQKISFYGSSFFEGGGGGFEEKSSKSGPDIPFSWPKILLLPPCSGLFLWKRGDFPKLQIEEVSKRGWWWGSGQSKEKRGGHDMGRCCACTTYVADKDAKKIPLAVCGISY